MPRQKLAQQELFNAKAATGYSQAIDVRNYRHVVICVSAALNSSLTFKFQGSAMDDAPDFSSAQAVANIWDYLHVYDLEDPQGGIDGDTGVTLNNDTVANNTRQYLVNTDHMQWFSLQISSYTSGSLTAYLVGVND